jgi:hypothetical protein
MNKNRRIALLLAVLFCLSAVTFVAVAKYIKDIPFTGNVTFKADLVENFTLTETKAERQTNGTYILSGEQVTQNTYILMPGVDVPKDPKITITGKTAVPAYLYVEVLESKNFPDEVTYTMAEGWLPLEGVPNVYYYETPITGTPAALTISILKNNTLTVSDQLPRGSTGTLSFHAYMAQQGKDQDAKTAFTTNFPTP